MKVIQITAAYKPAYIYGGPTMSVSQLCEALNETKQVDIEVLTTTANGTTELSLTPNSTTIVDGVKVTYHKRLTKDHTHFSPALLFNLIKLIKLEKEQNEVVIVHINAWWNLVSILSCWVAKWYKIPVVLSPRGMLTIYTQQHNHGFLKSTLHVLLGKRLLQYCHIHATSKKEQQDILAITKPKSITVIPNLVQLPTAQIQKKAIDSANFNLIFLSRIEEKKGLDILFDALAKLTFQWKLTIAGTGANDYIVKLKEKADSLKISKHITWVGHINNEEKFNLLAQHQLLVLTSHNENFANVVIESLYMGTPVLISNEVGLANYVNVKDLGWTTTLSVDEIAAQLSDSYYNFNKRKQIEANATSNISADFNPTTLANLYLKLYQQIT